MKKIIAASYWKEFSRALAARAAMTIGATLLVAIPTTSIAAPPADSSGEVLELIRRQVTAQGAFDVESLKAVTADNYIEISPAGEVDPRVKMLGFYAPEHKGPAPTMTVEDPVTRIFGDTVIVIAKLAYSMNGPDGNLRSVAVRASYVARKIGATWKLVSVQYTGIRPPREATPSHS
ncbi:MAG: nuclear transport factor 2 family protein [Burkholderiales bacterium]|jgi:ketosteroid isomerase-like protein|nr:nuclear transport factor 2 family protein [Burkholderiales bacterium]